MYSRLKELIIQVGYRFFKIVRAPIYWYYKKTNHKTFGVRVMVVYNNQLVLVRHWYNSLWVMPGGGIKKHETPEQAAVREVKEEIGIEIDQLDFKLGTYSNIKEGKNDTVYCFVVQINQQIKFDTQKFNLEVSDIIWAPFDALPEGTSKSTRMRIIQHLNNDITQETKPW